MKIDKSFGEKVGRKSIEKETKNAKLNALDKSELFCHRQSNSMVKEGCLSEVSKERRKILNPK